MVFITLYALFGDDIRILVTDKVINYKILKIFFIHNF